MSIQEKIKKSLDKHSLDFRSIVAYGVFGAIILVFALFGFPGSRGTLGQGVVAEVNGQLISGADLKEATAELERFYSQMFGGNFGMQAQRQLLENQAVENLISREILAQEATSSGVLATDREIREFIFEIPAFQDRGRFDKSRYYQYLEGARLSAQEFEGKIRKEAQRMRVRRLFDAVDRSYDLHKKAKEAIESYKFNIQFAKADRDAVVKMTAVSGSQIQDFLKGPENLKKIEVDYEANKGSLYTTSEEVKARHILIKVKEGDAAADAKAVTQLTDLKARATKEDFAKLARQFSEDEGSKSQGGDLGFFGRGKMVPAFEDAAFSAKVGDLVGPVKSTFGYHLIKIEGRKDQKVRTLDEVKGEIAKKLIAEKDVDERFQKLEEALSKKDYPTVEAQMGALNIHWEETGDYDLQVDSIPKLMGNESLQEAAAALTTKGQWLDHLVRDGSIRYVLKMKDVKKVDVPNKAKSDIAENDTMGLIDGWMASIRPHYSVRRNEGQQN